MPLRRWRWVEECPEWPEFVSWQEGLPWADGVQLSGGLEMLLRSGPQDNCPKLGDDLYAMYAGRMGTTFWIAVGDAMPGRRWLLPLAWGTNPSKNLTASVIAEALERLLKWREATK
jgi:hypothetical protein